jgi:RNA polymerase sigma-70 factor, ECF subfamily
MNQNAHLNDYTGEIRIPPQKSDLDLVRKIAVGEEGALEELYHRYHLIVFNYLVRTTQDTTSAEDLLQEVFIGVWEGAARFEGRASVKTWLFRIAHFQTATWLRRQIKLPENQSTESCESLANPEKPSLESEVFQRLNFSHIQRAIGQLSPNQREVIEFSFIHGLSHNEIANILVCPVGTVKSRLHNALRQLNGILIAQGIVTQE